MAYRVVIADGPAQGWSYVTFVPPDPIIAVAPAREDFPQGDWMRVVAGAPEPWPGQLDYERDVLPTDVGLVDEDGDVAVTYCVRSA
jgi:hypothetical protein